jgi:replication factor C subunit 1
MDEVDGVTGNEDRGGIQTLIKHLQTARIPIILIANDRQAVKMRTLATYCYEIKFDRPSFLNVKSFILDICSREYIHITHTSLDYLINVCNRDIRKIIHTLNLYYKQSSSIISNISNIEKALSTSPFDACMKMFSPSNMSLIDKTNLYFHDYSLVPLLIQENYLRIVPSITAERKPVGTKQRLELISKAADSLAIGDVCSKLNFTNASRSLMGYQVSSLVEYCSSIFYSLVDVFWCYSNNISSRFIRNRSISFLVWS